MCASFMLSLLIVATPEKCATLVFSLSHKTLHSADTFFFFPIMKQLKVCIAWDMNIKFPSIFNQPGGMSLARTGLFSSEQVQTGISSIQVAVAMSLVLSPPCIKQFCGLIIMIHLLCFQLLFSLCLELRLKRREFMPFGKRRRQLRRTARML